MTTVLLLWNHNKNLQCSVQLNGSKHVFKREDKVYKLYNEKLLTPRVDVMNFISSEYISMNKIHLSADNLLVCYESKYFDVKDKSKIMLSNFRPIMEALDKIHENGYVHSDARAANLLFPTTSSAKLIDFDLSDKNDSKYPTELKNAIALQF